MKTHRILLAAVGILVTAPFAGVRDAAACTDTGTGDFEDAYVAPASGATIPQDSQGIFYRPPTGCGLRFETTGVALTNDMGMPVHFTELTLGVEGFLLVPAGALPLGKYRLAYPAAGSGCRDIVSKVAEFTIGPSAPWPTTAALTATASVSNVDCPATGDAGTTCSFMTPAYNQQSARIDIKPAAALEPHRALVRYETKVDGVQWGISKYGSTETPRLGIPFDRINAQCGGEEGYGGPYVSPGKHTVEVRALLLGTSQATAPVKVEIDLSCPADTPVGAAARSKGCSQGRSADDAPTYVAVLLGGAAIVTVAERRRRRSLGR